MNAKLTIGVALFVVVAHCILQNECVKTVPLVVLCTFFLFYILAAVFILYKNKNAVYSKKNRTLSYPEFVEKTKRFTKNEDIALHIGGTLASALIRDALHLIEDKRIKNDSLANLEQQKYIFEIIELLRNALIRHNSQDVKFIEYDIETGTPK